MPHLRAGWVERQGGAGSRRPQGGGREGGPAARPVRLELDHGPELVHRAGVQVGRDADAAAHADAGREPRRVPDEELLRLPKDFPPEVDAVATDLDNTLTWQDGVLRPRTVEALGRTRDVGVPVIVV